MESSGSGISSLPWKEGPKDILRPLGHSQGLPPPAPKGCRPGPKPRLDLFRLSVITFLPKLRFLFKSFWNSGGIRQG